MRVHPLKSIRAKLFYFTVTLVLLAVAANSGQNGTTFKSYLDRQFEAEVLSSSEDIASVIESTFDTLYTPLSLIANNMHTMTKLQLTETLDGVIHSNDEYVAITIFDESSPGKLRDVNYAFTSSDDTTLFEDKQPQKISKALRSFNARWIQYLSKRHKSKAVHLRSLAIQMGLPLMNYAIKFSTKGTARNTWLVLTVWQTIVSRSLPASEDIESAILTSTGKVLTSRSKLALRKPDIFEDLDIVKMSKSKHLQGAFLRDYTDSQGSTWLGAFKKLEKYDFMILIQQDANTAQVAIRRVIIRSILWATLFTLISILLSYLGSASITENLRKATAATQKIAAGDFNTMLTKNSNDEIGVLSESVNYMTQRIRSLLYSQVEKARFEKELETAQTVQNTLFPAEDTQAPILELKGFYTPASECGGDWWGHFRGGNNNKEYVIIADAMGHGVPAALVTAMAYSCSMTISDMISQGVLNRQGPDHLLEIFNRVLYDALKGKLSMTFFVCEIDLAAGIMTFANGGHNFPLLLPRDPEDERIKKKIKSLQKISPITPISLSLKGTPLGVDREAKFATSTIPIKPGDKLFFFTDGLIECTSPEGKMWGRKTMLEHILRHVDKDPEGICEGIVSDAFAHFDGQPLDDDITIVTAEIIDRRAALSSSTEQAEAEQEANPHLLPEDDHQKAS